MLRSFATIGDDRPLGARFQGKRKRPWAPAGAVAGVFVMLAAMPAPADVFAAAPSPAPAASDVVQTLPKEVIIPRYKPGPIPRRSPRLLVYQASWIGIPAATVTIELHANSRLPGHFVGEATAQTNRLVDLFWRMRDYFREDFDLRSLSLGEAYVRQQENRRFNEYTLLFDPASRIVTGSKRNRKGVETHAFLSDNPYGLFSGAVMGLLQPLDVGQSYTFDVFAAVNRCVLHVEITGRDRLRTRLGVFEVFRVTPTVTYVKNDLVQRTARATTAWVTVDQPHLPIRIEAAAFVGYVRVDLVRVIDAPESPASVTTPAASAASQ
jgi:hypothetical protein